MNVSIFVEHLNIVEVGKNFLILTVMLKVPLAFKCLTSSPSSSNKKQRMLRWIDPSPVTADHQPSEVVSYLMNKFKDGENLCDRLKEKLKEVEEERDTLSEKLKDREKKLIALQQKFKEVKLERECAKLKFNKLLLLIFVF
ncbi:hypothetical protein FXO37_17138 [Capsicum annuum]|nr:hypothetical protein FXO37_17138 [Capsicum annuum]